MVTGLSRDVQIAVIMDQLGQFLDQTKGVTTMIKTVKVELLLDDSEDDFMLTDPQVVYSLEQAIKNGSVDYLALLHQQVRAIKLVVQH